MLKENNIFDLNRYLFYLCASTSLINWLPTKITQTLTAHIYI